MSHTTKSPKEGQIEFTVTVTPDEYTKHLPAAAQRLSEKKMLKGFRPGKAPHDIVRREMGDMAILQEALEKIVQDSFYQAVTAEKIETIGMPKIAIEKLAPGNDLVYQATVALFPTVAIGDLAKINITKNVKPVDEKTIEETIEALRGMQASEAVKDCPASGNDKLVIDMDMFLDRVPVDGGTAKNYQVYLGEPHYIPGLNDQLSGLKKDDVKEFSLDFPPTHYQKMLAGKKVDFKVKVKEVYERTLPPLADDFAKKLGQENLTKLRELVRGNLMKEAEEKAEEKYHIELFEALTAASTFGFIPEIIIDAERRKMFFELKRDLERHSVSVEQYLADIKKNEQELFAGFKEAAEKRAKAALLSRQIAKDQSLAPAKEEIEAELKLMREAYKDQPEYLENLEHRETKETLATIIQNHKALDWIKKQVEKNRQT